MVLSKTGIILTFLIHLSIYSQENCNDLNKYDLGRKYQILEQFIKEIDSGTTVSFKGTIEGIISDTNKYCYLGEEYSMLDYIKLKLFVSGNVITCNRMKFLEETINLDRNSNKKIIKGFVLYSKRNITELKLLNEKTLGDSINQSFLPSLILTLEIESKTYSLDYHFFLTQVDSVYNAYSELKKTPLDFCLLLPMCEVLFQWHKIYPEVSSDCLNKYIDSKKWVGFESAILGSYIYDMFYNKPKCYSTFNLDILKLLYSTSSVTPDRYFFTSEFLESRGITNKKRRFKRTRKNNRC